MSFPVFGLFADATKQVAQITDVAKQVEQVTDAAAHFAQAAEGTQIERMTDVNVFLMGVIATTCWVAAVFFLRFWRDTHDRLFAIFSAAFLLLGLTRLALIFVEAEDNHYVYWVRLAAFVLILVAIIDKNRPRRAGTSRRT